MYLQIPFVHLKIQKVIEQGIRLPLEGFVDERLSIQSFDIVARLCNYNADTMLKTLESLGYSFMQEDLGTAEDLNELVDLLFYQDSLPDNEYEKETGIKVIK